MDFGEIRSWSGKPKDEFLNNLPWILPTLEKFYRQDPGAYKNTILPYIQDHWKGLYPVHFWSDFKVLSKLLPNGRYSYVGDRLDRDHISSVKFPTRIQPWDYRGLKEFKTYNYSRAKNFLMLLKEHPLDLEMLRVTDEIGEEPVDIIQLKPLIKNLERLEWGGVWREYSAQDLESISHIPDLNLAPLSSNLFSHGVSWKVEKLRLGIKGEPTLEPSWEPLPSVKFLDLSFEPRSYFDLSHWKILFPNLTSLELQRFSGELPSETTIPEGYWEKLALPSAVSYEPGVYIKKLSQSFRNSDTHRLYLGRHAPQVEEVCYRGNYIGSSTIISQLEQMNCKHLNLRGVTGKYQFPRTLEKLTLTQRPKRLTLLHYLIDLFGDKLEIKNKRAFL